MAEREMNDKLHQEHEMFKIEKELKERERNLVFFDIDEGHGVKQDLVFLQHFLIHDIKLSEETGIFKLVSRDSFSRFSYWSVTCIYSLTQLNINTKRGDSH